MLFFSLPTADRPRNDSTAGRDMGWNGCRNFELAANSIPGPSNAHRDIDVSLVVTRAEFLMGRVFVKFWLSSVL